MSGDSREDDQSYEQQPSNQDGQEWMKFDVWKAMNAEVLKKGKVLRRT